MLARFHKVNEASRRKKKQIPEEIWEQHEPYIDEECRKGTSVKYIARLIERQSIPDFAPRYVPNSVYKPSLIAVVAVNYGIALARN